MKYSVLIPVYNMPESLLRLLQSLLANRSEIIGEIHVYFDGSPVPDSTPKHQILHIHKGDINMGLVYARSFLIQQARFQRVLFLDADSLPEPGFFDVLKSLGEKQLFAGQESRGHEKNLWQQWRLRFFRQTLGTKRLENAPTLCGLCFGGDRTLIKDIGFSPRFRNHGEDVDFAFRAISTNVEICYEPALCVFHDREDDHQSLIGMIKNHIRYQSLAYRIHGANTWVLVKNQIKLIPVSVYSSIRRAKSLPLAIISLYLGILALFYRFCYLICRI
ncbi:MAG: glycosyltransferase [Candidatus Cloacimonetes bacterium]|nr:glycosyltransferase [Candidatus Cloacimonadota bacterium]